MTNLKIIAAMGAVILGSLFVFLLATRDVPAQPIEPGVITFTDHLHKCAYVVGGTDDGLYIIVNGDAHCHARIIIDGVRINLGHKASL